jgi:hypothetical protein
VDEEGGVAWKGKHARRTWKPIHGRQKGKSKHFAQNGRDKKVWHGLKVLKDAIERKIFLKKF